MKTIVLTGMMGSGKTTIGKLFASRLNYKFIDLDSVIETHEKCSISEIFKNKGESYFRYLEKQLLFEIFMSENSVIALGGGTFENEDIRDFLLNNSNVIYLFANPKVIYNRIKNENTRPLLAGDNSVDKINKIFTVRNNNYEKAHYKITTENKSPDAVADEILGVLHYD